MPGPPAAPARCWGGSLERASCCICGSARSRPYLTNWDRSHGQPGVFTFVACRDCGHVYLDPRPTGEELDAYYPPNYRAHARALDDEPNLLTRLSRRYGLRKRARELTRRRGQPGRLLDVGCGSGLFLDEMRRRGWDVAGVEPSSHAAAYAVERLGLPVRATTLEAACFQSQSFDAVTLWHVLEHVPDSRRTLEEARRLLRPNGVILAATPNRGSFDAHLFGRYWAEWEAPRHLNVLDDATLVVLLGQLGFMDVQVRSGVGSWLGFATSLEFWWRSRGETAPDLAAARSRREWHRARALLPLRAALLPYFTLVDRLGKGSTMTATARLPESGVRSDNTGASSGE